MNVCPSGDGKYLLTSLRQVQPHSQGCEPKVETLPVETMRDESWEPATRLVEKRLQLGTRQTRDLILRYSGVRSFRGFNE
jgi:hypothetical protein